MQNNKTIIVGGVGRSGTSILSLLLATAHKSEYFYEPAVVYYLIDSIDNFKDKEEWKKLFKISVCKDLLKGALSGRNINLNPNDNSSIYKYKTKKEIKQRHKKSYTQFEINKLVEHANAVIKLLDNIYKFRQVNELIKNVKAVIIYRNPVDTINSILRKGWFSDEQLKLSGPEPAREMVHFKGYRINKFVDRSMYDKWISMPEIDRISYYYQFHIEKFKELTKLEDVTMVSYDRLVDDPGYQKKVLFHTLHLKDGDMTAQVLNSIKPTQNTLNERGYLVTPGEHNQKQNRKVYQKLDEVARESSQIN